MLLADWSESCGSFNDHEVQREPFRIDLLTNIPAVEFEEAWRERSFVEFDGVTVPVISKRHLIANKRSVGRLQDLADAEALKSSMGRRHPPGPTAWSIRSGGATAEGSSSGTPTSPRTTTSSRRRTRTTIPGDMTPRPDADRPASLPPLRRVSQVADAYVVSRGLPEGLGDWKERHRAPRSWVLAGLSM